MASPSDHDNAEEATPNVRHRGPTFKKKIIRKRSKGGQKIVVKWNTKGQPIGRNGRDLISYIGSKVRQTVPITCNSWRSPALNDLKDEIWRDVQMTFEVDETRKSTLIKRAGKMHRTFRTNLTREYVRDNNGNVRRDPPPEYRDFISMEDWRAFVAKRTGDEEFLRISEENRQRALDPHYPYKGGVKGYPFIEENMLLEEGRDPEVDSIERHILWLEARKNVEGVIDHPPTREVAERIETLTQAVSQGEITDCDGRKDILAQALPAREYGGRCRGVGFGVTQKTIFGSQKRAKQEETTELRRLVTQLFKEVQELKASKQDKEPVEGHEPNLPTPTPRSVRDSCTPVTPEGINACNLYLSSPTHRLVARGTVYNESGATLHNLPIPPSHVKVGVEFAVEGDAPLPVPLVNADVMTVEQAIGTYVAWPSHLVAVAEKSKVKDKGKVPQHRPSKNVGKPRPSPRPPIIDKEQTNGSITSPLKKKSESQPTQHPITHCRADFIAFLRVHLLTRMGKGNISIPMEPEILGYEHTLELGGEGAEIGEIVNHEWLSQTVISVYLRYLYQEILIPKEQTRRFVFLCPQQTHMVFDSVEIKQYIAERLALAKPEDETLFLSPCNVVGHWVLLVINPKEDTVYYLDPLHMHFNNHKKMRDTYNEALLINRGLYGGKSRFSKSSKMTKWISIMFIKDTIIQNQMQIPTTYFPECKFIT